MESGYKAASGEKIPQPSSDVKPDSGTTVWQSARYFFNFPVDTFTYGAGAIGALSPWVETLSAYCMMTMLAAICRFCFILKNIHLHRLTSASELNILVLEDSSDPLVTPSWTATPDFVLSEGSSVFPMSTAQTHPVLPPGNACWHSPEDRIYW